MPQYEIDVPGYGKYRVESPTELTDAQAYAAIQDQIGKEPKPKTGVGAAVSRGLESLISSGRTAVGAVTGDAGEAARAGIARGEDIQRRYANQTDMGRVTEAYNKDGILSAGRELVSQIPYALAEQAPNLAAMAGSARLGAMAGSVFGPVGTAVGGGLGAFAPSFLQQMGSNVERQAQEGQPVSTGTAAAAAVPQAGLDLASQYLAFGGKLIQKLTGIPTQALFSRSAAQASKLADERLLTTLAKGTAIGGVAEIPTEIAQQMIERAQAGLSLTTPDALKEYGETAYQVGLLAPLGAVGRLSERGGARQQVAQTAQEQAAAQAAQQQQALQEQEQQQAQLLDSPEYAQTKKAEYDAAVAERQRLSDASKAPEGADPLAVADAAEAAKALKEYDKKVMGPLVEEARRVRALHPQFFPAPTPPAPAAAPVTGIPATPAPTGAEAAAAVAPTPPVEGEETDTAYVAKYVQFLMQTPARAQQIVDTAEELPGLTPQQSETVRSVLTLQLKPTKRGKKAPTAAPAVEEAAPVTEEVAPTAEKAKRGRKPKAVVTETPVAEVEEVAPTETAAPTETPPAPAEEDAPNYPAIDAATTGTGTFRSRIVRGVGTSEKTRDELVTDLQIAKQTRDRAGVRQAIDALRDLKARGETEVPLGVETRGLATPLPPSVNRATDARIARGQAFAQVLMAKPEDVDAARGRLLERLTTDIELGSGRRMPQSERYKLAAQTNPLLDAILKDKTPANAKKTQDALNDIYNQYVAPAGEAPAPVVKPRAAPAAEPELPVEKGVLSALKATPQNAPEVRTRSAEASTARQERLQAIERARQSRSGVQVSFEERRRAETAQDRARAKLEATATDKTLPIEERRAAQEALAALEVSGKLAAAKDQDRLTAQITKRNVLQAKVNTAIKTLENPDALLTAKESQRAARDAAIQALLDKGAPLTNRQKAYVAKNGLMTREQLAQPRLEALENDLVTLKAELAAADRKVAGRDRVTITPLLTKEEQAAETKAEVTDRRRDRIQAKLDQGTELNEQEIAFVADNKMLSDEEVAKIAAAQTKRRATSPVMKTQSSAPSALRMGTAEDTERTRTRATGPFESTKPKERNIPVGKKDIEAANVAAEAMQPERTSTQQDIRNAEARLNAVLNKVVGLKSKLGEAQARVARLEQSKGFVGTRTETAPKGVKPVIPPSVAPALKNARETVASLKTELAAAQNEAKQSQKEAGMDAASRFAAQRATTPLSAQAKDIAEDGRILDLADEIAKNGSTPEIRALAAKLRPLLLRTKLSVDAAVNYNGESVAGLYSPRNNAITMHPEGLTEEDVLHEMGHAATDYVLLADPATLTADQRAARKGLEALHASITKSALFEGEQGIADVREFVAEVLSNNGFRNRLDAVGKPTSLLQRVIGFIKRMFGAQPAASSKDAEALIDRILAPSRKLVAKETPSLFRKEATFSSNDALSTLAQQVVAQPKGGRETYGSNVMLKLEMKTTDMRAGLREAIKAGAKAMGNDKLFTQAMYSVVKADQKMPLVMAALSNGPLKLYEDAKGFKGVTTTGKDSAKDVFEAVSKIPDTYGDSRAKTALATTYMIAQRAANKGLARLDTGALGVTQKQLDDAMRAVNADPVLKSALESVRKKYNAYNAGMIQFLVDTGALPKDKGADLLKYGDYVPFYRVRSDGVAELVFGEEQTITIGDVRYQPHLAQLKGGEEKILPLDQSIYRNTMLLTDKAMTNMAARNVAYALQTFGKTATKDAMPIHRGQGPTGPDIIRFTQEPDPSIEDDNGTRWLQVKTEGTSMEGIPAELVVKSLEGAHLTLPAFLKWGGVAGDLLRAGVTRTPIYLARQLFRDPMAAAFTTGLNYNPLRAIFKANKEFYKIYAGSSETGAKLIEKGLVQSGIFTGDPDDISKFALQLASGKDLGALDRLFAMADKAAINADTATRALVYDNAIANGLSEVEADMATMESMNFYKRGLSPTVQYASRLIPFFNSQIQGLNVLYKAARGRMPFNEQLAIKRKFMNNAMLLMGVGVAYAMAMDDDEYYRNAKPKDRYSNFFLHLPGVDEPVKLPIPYEAGWFFSAAVAAVDAIKGETDGEQQWVALKDMVLGSIPGYGSKFVPQIVKPFAEFLTNKQFYNGQDLESKRLQNLTPDQRYNRNTTELAKAVSKAVPILSPIQIEHIVSGYLGQLPIMAMAAADGLFTTDQSVEEPTRRMSERPLVGTSFQRKYGGEDADVVYKLATDAMQAKASLDSLISTGKAQDAKEFRQEHIAEIAVAPLAKQYQTIMGTLRKQEEIIRASKSFTADQKRERIDNIDKQRQLQSEKFLQAIKRAEASVGA